MRAPAAILAGLLAAATAAAAPRKAPAPPVPVGSPQPVASEAEVGPLPGDREPPEISPGLVNPFRLPNTVPVAEEQIVVRDKPEDKLKTIPITGRMLGATGGMVLLGDLILRPGDFISPDLVPYDGRIVLKKIERERLVFSITPNALTSKAPEPYEFRMPIEFHRMDAVKSRFQVGEAPPQQKGRPGQPKQDKSRP